MRIIGSQPNIGVTNPATPAQSIVWVADPTCSCLWPVQTERGSRLTETGASRLKATREAEMLCPHLR